jgi:hypothetical protein
LAALLPVRKVVLPRIRLARTILLMGDMTCNAWVTANPVSKRNRLTNMEFLRGCQIRPTLPVRDPRARGIVCGKKGCVQHLFDFVDHELKYEVTKGGRTIRRIVYAIVLQDHPSAVLLPVSTTRAFVPAPKHERLCHEPLCREVLVPIAWCRSWVWSRTTLQSAGGPVRKAAWI